MNGRNIIAKCDKCGARNRIPENRMRDRPVCGKCRAPLSTTLIYPEYPLNVNDQSFFNEVVQFRGAAAAFFWAPSCPHCVRMLPLIDELAKQYAGKIKFVKLVTEQSPATASRFDVLGVPTLILFKAGRQVNRLFGALPKEQLEYHLHALL